MPLLWNQCDPFHVAQIHNNELCFYRLPSLIAMPPWELTASFMALLHITQHFSSIATFETPPAPSNSYMGFFISSEYISLCCSGRILLLYPPDKAAASMIEFLPPTMRLAANLIWELFISSWYLLLTTIKVEITTEIPWTLRVPGLISVYSCWLFSFIYLQSFK